MLLLCILVISQPGEELQAQSHQLPSVRELSDGVDQRLSKYQDVKFLYDSRIRTRSSAGQSLNPADDTHGHFVASREVLKLHGQPDWNDIGRLNVSWLRYQRTAIGGEKLQEFFVTDVTKTFHFDRWRPGMMIGTKYNEASILDRSLGSKSPNSLFPTILFQRVNGVTLWDLYPSTTCRPEVWEHRLDQFKVAGLINVDGQNLYRLTCETGPPDEGSWIEVDMSGAPDFMIYRQEYFYQRKSSMLMRVQQVSKINGVAYPSKGSYHTDALGQIHEATYEFQISFAGSLSETDHRTWVPAWPPNTMVQEPASLKMYVVGVPSPLVHFSTPMKRVVLTLIGSMITVAVLNALWFAWAQQGFERRLIVFVIGFALPTALIAVSFDASMAIIYGWINCLVLLIAIPSRNLLGTTIMQQTASDGVSDVDSRMKIARTGLREWGAWTIAAVYAVLLYAALEFSQEQRHLATLVTGSIAFTQIVMFYASLTKSAFWPFTSTAIAAILLWMFVQVPLQSLVDIPYWEKDSTAWHCSLVVGFGLFVSAAFAIRNFGFRVTWNRGNGNIPMADNERLSLREMIVWITAMGVLLATTRLLGGIHGIAS